TSEYRLRIAARHVPTSDAVSVALHEMDRFGIELGMIATGDDTSRLVLKKHRDGFVPAGNIDAPNDVTGTVRAMRRQHEEFGIRAVSVFPAGTFPPVAIRNQKMSPRSQTCVALGIPIFCPSRVPPPPLTNYG